MDKPLIFIHIPKTAGTAIATVAQHLKIAVKGHDIRDPNFAHLDQYDVASFNQYHIFAVVRNPWDRVLSSFLYLQTGGRNIGDAEDGKKFVQHYQGDFNQFVESAFVTDDILEQLHFMPQYRWVCDAKENLLVDTIIKFENFQTEMDLFLSKNGRKPLKIPKVNATVHKHYTEYYSKKAIEIIAKVYEKDISFFNYSYQ
ncbi:sulfotransferase family 2 domain-containing protein [Algibacter sp. 2305UL17-15]|uniref:sulfotransferase family 2 domain-containing protein n=1 Tax=Algibacter sp. 2305UL17-15 TaxID=3231268 RepID=UPI0034583747